MDTLPVPPMPPGWNMADRQALCISKNVFEFLFSVMFMAYILCCVMQKDLYGCDKIAQNTFFCFALAFVSAIALAMSVLDTNYNENSGYVMADEGVSKTIMAFTIILAGVYLYIFVLMFIKKTEGGAGFMTKSYYNLYGFDFSIALVSLVMAFVLFCLVIKQWVDNAELEYKSMMIQVPEAVL